MKIPIRLRTFGDGGVHATFPKQYFKPGQIIQVEIDDLSANLQVVKAEMDELKFQVIQEVKQIKEELKGEIRVELMKELPRYGDLMEIEKKLDQVIAFERR